MVNLVMGPRVTGAAIRFRDQKTYQLIRQPGPIDDRLFEIEFLEAGADVYCFTFS